MRESQTASVGWPILLTYGGTVGLMLVAALFSDERLWGFNWYSYFGWATRLCALAAAAVILVVSTKIHSAGEQNATPASGGFGRAYGVSTAVLIGLVLIAFWLARARTHFLGDGYQLLASLQSGVNHKPWEAGTFLVQRSVYSLLGGVGESTAEMALQIVSYACGLSFALVSALVSARLFTSYGRRVLYLLGVSTAGYALLFFGYFESYPLFILAVGCLFQAGLLIARDKLSRWYLLPLLVVAAFFHIFTVALLPGVMYLVLRGTPVGRRISGLSHRLKWTAAAGIFLVAAAAFGHFYYHSFFFRFTIVPLLSDRNTVEGYTLFSGKHLLDYLSHFFQLFPGLAVALAALWPVVGRQTLRRPAVVFCLLTLLPSMGLVFIFNPGLGFPRDWDLYSFVGVPLVCGAFYLLLDEERTSHSGLKVAVLSVTLGLLILVPRIASQAIPEKGIALFDNYAQLDRVKNSSGRYLVRQYLISQGKADEAERRRVRDNAALPEGEWIDNANRMIARGELDAGIALLRKAAASDPTNYSAWANLGTAYGFRNMNDSAILFLEIADARMPFNADVKRNLGGIYFTEGDLGRAEQMWRESAAISPENPDTKVRLLLLYEKLGREADLQALLKSPSASAAANLRLLLQSAELSLKTGEDAVAAALLRRAIQMGADTNAICDLQRRYPRIHVIDCP